MAGPLLPTPQQLHEHLENIRRKQEEKPINWNCQCDCCVSRNATVRDIMRECNGVIAGYATAIKKMLWALDRCEYYEDWITSETLSHIQIPKYVAKHNKWARQLEARRNALEDMI